MTTRSLPALKSYLAGERHFRTAEFEAAVEDYRRAVREGSTFALVHARLAEAVGWASATSGDVEVRSMQRANELADRLPARERRLFRTSLLYKQDRVVAAADSLRQLAADYPDDPAVWYRLDEVTYHDGVPGGWPEADEAYRKAVELDPGHVPYFIHHVQLAIAYHHDSTLAAEWAARHPNPEASKPWFSVGFALAFGDADRREKTLVRLDGVSTGDPPRWARMSLQHPEDRDAE